MRVEVIELRRLGHKLAKQDLAGAIAGCLVIEHWTLTLGQDGERIVREASLRRTYSKGEPPLLAPLQDAEVTRADERGMLIVGIQRDGDIQYRQAWWVRPT
jgi:hypothetical protein